MEMTIDVNALAAQIYVRMVAPQIFDRASQGSGLDKLYKTAAAHSLAAAAEFGRVAEETAVA